MQGVQSIYPSEVFTQSIILFFVKHVTRKEHIYKQIKPAASSTTSNKERTYYFWYGGFLFSLLGFVAVLLSVGGLILSLSSHWVSFLWILFVFPGWFFYAISFGFRMKANETEIDFSDQERTEYSSKDLLVAALIALIPSVFIVLLLHVGYWSLFTDLGNIGKL